MARLLADVTMVVHLAFLAFVVFGGFVGWRWPAVIVPHLIAVGWGALVIAASLQCPLTHLEDALRRAAGQPGLPRGFIDTYINGVLYPSSAAPLILLLVVGAVLVSWLGAYHRCAQPPLLELIRGQAPWLRRRCRTRIPEVHFSAVRQVW